MGDSIKRLALLSAAALAIAGVNPGAIAAVIDDAADLYTQQQQEKDELKDMRQEMDDIRRTIKDAQDNAEKVVREKMARPGTSAQEVHLIAKESILEPAPGISSTQFTYNGEVPGPVIRVQEGQPVRIVVHNQLRSPTSLTLHGMLLPHAVSGLPRKDAGLVAPGQTYAFQFIAPAAGTYWYHPQVVHGDQMSRGLYGAIVVEPAANHKTYERDQVLILGKTLSAGKTIFTVNGKTAPAIPPIEVKSGERIRLRVINAGDFACPLYLSGHRFEVVAVDGSDPLEPHVTRDTITVQPGERYDLEFTANNPGVWSLSSLLPAQTTADGKFPGGIAIVVRYPEVMK
jgi:FtsP/CotA-like multicopper oxidase with cupredoxin domain